MGGTPYECIPEAHQCLLFMKSMNTISTIGRYLKSSALLCMHCYPHPRRLLYNTSDNLLYRTTGQLLSTTHTATDEHNTATWRHPQAHLLLMHMHGRHV